MAVKTITLIPTVVNLNLYAGDGVELRLEISDEDGNPLPLAGTFKVQIRTHRSDPSAAVSFTATLGPGDGIVNLSLSGAQTASLCTDFVDNPGDAFNGVWDVEYKATGSEPVTITQGSVTCAPDVSR